LPSRDLRVKPGAAPVVVAAIANVPSSALKTRTEKARSIAVSPESD
jgi:hypothetical protein